VEASYPDRAAAAIAQDEAGARVDFKTVQISREGIHIKDRTLSWTSVADTDTDGAIMLVKKIGQTQPWSVVRVIQISNEDILPVLIGHSEPNNPSLEAKTRRYGVRVSSHPRIFASQVERAIASTKNCFYLRIAAQIAGARRSSQPLSAVRAPRMAQATL
jgi:hypothetical protein